MDGTRSNAFNFKFKIGCLADFNDMLSHNHSHSEFRVKQETKIPYFLCELNVASAKRDGG